MLAPLLLSITCISIKQATCDDYGGTGWDGRGASRGRNFMVCEYYGVFFVCLILFAEL